VSIEYKHTYIANSRYVYTDLIKGLNITGDTIKLSMKEFRKSGFFGNVMVLPLYNY